MTKTNLLNIISITSKLTLLYIEDNDSSRIQALKLLENYFSNIDVAIDGLDGLNKYNDKYINTNRYYDLVITDIEMPRMNGISLTKEIYKSNPNQKIIIISAYNDKKYFIDLINIGVEGFIQKPLSYEHITEALSNFSQKMKNNSLVQLAYGCSYDNILKSLFLDKIKIEITKNENKFIEFLIDNQNRTITNEDIFNAIYYDDPNKDFSYDVIKGLVKRLRKKLPLGVILYNRTNGYSIKFK